MPTGETLLSSAQYTTRPSAREYQLLPMMPCTAGVVPVAMLAWPGPV